jgi:hypothetical protein
MLALKKAGTHLDYTTCLEIKREQYPKLAREADLFESANGKV